jgi:hypothetical protein
MATSVMIPLPVVVASRRTTPAPGTIGVTNRGIADQGRAGQRANRFDPPWNEPVRPRLDHAQYGVGLTQTVSPCVPPQ